MTFSKTTMLAAVLLSACGAEPAEPACDVTARTTSNAITFNAIAFNAISYNAISYNGLAGADLDLSCDPTSALAHEYLVQCALAPDQAITVRTGGAERVLRGALGLAPEWLDGPCDEDCRGWVSACLIARTNARGERVDISLRGDHPGLALDDGEAEAFPVHEASYYGDVLSGDLVAMACLGDGVDHLDRVCGDLDDCPIEIQGRCADLCDGAGCRADGAIFHPVSVYRASETITDAPISEETP